MIWSRGSKTASGWRTCSRWIIWRRGCGVIVRTCWCWRGMRCRGGGVARWGWWMCCGRRCRRLSSMSGSLTVQPGIAVRGQAVNDVVHLLAELAENATSFSAADTPVAVSGHLLNSGGVLLEITDQGVGMRAEEMAHANWRLDNPPVVDVAVSRRMGLFVVARLAARHGIRVRLRPASMGGLTALVWLPDEVIAY